MAAQTQNEAALALAQEVLADPASRKIVMDLVNSRGGKTLLRAALWPYGPIGARAAGLLVGALAGGPVGASAGLTVADAVYKHAHSNPRRRRNGGSKIQSLIFDRSKFSGTQARDWARSHGFKVTKIDVTANTIRIRQFPPSSANKQTFGTIRLKDGVQATVAVPRRRR